MFHTSPRRCALLHPHLSHIEWVWSLWKEGVGAIVPQLSSSQSTSHKVVRGQCGFGIRCGWSLGALGGKFCFLPSPPGERRWPRESWSPLFPTLSPQLPWWEEGASGCGCLGKEIPSAPPPPPPPACPPQIQWGRGLPGGGVGARSAGADRRARAGKRLLRESPSPPKSPKLAATSKDARNLHLAL